MITAGVLAGVTNGLLGAGGGMILVPALKILTDIGDPSVFPASISIILPLSVVSLLFSFRKGTIPWNITLPLLIGSILGGILAGIFSRKIPTKWLHRALGIFILLGGIRYLC